MKCQCRFHPQVPVSVASLWMEYCHQCGAWLLDRSVYTQDGEDRTPEIIWPRVEFGPFDTLEQVAAAGSVFVKELLLPPGRPWDLRRSDPRTTPPDVA
jgi:hypothetical protein